MSLHPDGQILSSVILKQILPYLENYNDQVEHSFVQDIKAEDMDYILKAQLPITDRHQVSILGELLKSNKIRSQRQFIYQLWKAKSPIEPEKRINHTWMQASSRGCYLRQRDSRAA